MSRRDVRFRSGDAECAAWLYLPDASGPAPVVVMGHGLGAIREMRLDAYAERFTAAGYACLVFDYRHFGASGGEPRQLLSVARELEDWRSAIACARTLPEVDGDRVAIWGSSLGGGHVIATAADVPVAAAIAQCPFTDGIASTLAIPPLTSLRVVARAVRDLVSTRRGGVPVTVPLAGDPGTTALMTARDARPGYLALVPEGVDFRNEAAARVAFDILRYRPGARARKVRCPLHVTITDKDTVAPARTTSRLVNKAPRAEVVHRPVGHFDIYDGEEFESVVADQIAFLHRHVPVS
ncbi:MAG: alpha/beta hydrolase [Actinomycetota bacterium]